VQPVILAGGSGTRLWPMSREHYPKQLIGLLGDHSLLQSTALRLDGLAASHPVNDDVLIVCGEDHRFTTAEQLRVTGKRASIMLEPLGRDTAPALTLAALRIVADGGDAVMTVMPADHAVADRTRFHAAVAAGVHCAAQGKIATMGIVPARAETGYGYIRVGAPLGDAATGGLDVRRLDRFVEKPHLELARQYVESGEYWWNSGIFIVRASVWLDAIRRLEPEIHAACEQAVANGKQDGDFFRVDRDAFAASPSNSIDYAVMEPLASQPQLCESVVVPLDAGWSDVGSWDAIWQILPKDDAGNVGRGHVLFENADSTFAHAEPPGRLCRHAESGRRRDARRGARRGQIARAGREEDRRPHQGRARRGSDRPSQGPSAVGPLRLGRHGRALPGQAHRREAGRAAVAADAPSPRRALDRRARHGASRAATKPSCSPKTNRPTFRSACRTGSRTPARCRSN
jgi:mannose-1-phosphate guanylyltransferase/mannose-6-phosphate isomerase